MRGMETWQRPLSEQDHQPQRVLLSPRIPGARQLIKMGEEVKILIEVQSKTENLRLGGEESYVLTGAVVLQDPDGTGTPLGQLAIPVPHAIWAGLRTGDVIGFAYSEAEHVQREDNVVPLASVPDGS